MKSIKLVMITAIVAITMVTIAKAEHPSKIDESKRTINLTFEQAMKNPGLVAAMYEQLHNDFLGGNSNQQLYTVTVVYMNYNFRITGTYTQWFLFFKIQWTQSLPNET
ncbi:MAG: hypothetical protein U9R60_14330 [Bacteroidota bacterium]|nr:hypothetical protein [Bacteroidota bacterium]